MAPVTAVSDLAHCCVPLPVRVRAVDFAAMLRRAKDVGITHMMVTGGSLADSKEALELARTDGRCPSSC